MGARTTPLLDEHRKRGAKLTEFGGWEMPLQFSGVVAEHRAVRSSTGVFDVSHLGKLRVSGSDAGDALQHALTADVLALATGRATYSLVLTDAGGCVDDVFCYRTGEAEWLIVPNAANTAAVADSITSSGGEPMDEWDRWAILAIQGPQSFETFESVWPGTGAPDLALHSWTSIDVFGHEGMVARTGYTGERGFELYAPAETATEAFTALIEAGGEPVGLGARDTLRLEMGYPLYGHELTEDINPLEARLGWTLAWDSPFRGRAALEKVRAEGPARRLTGISCRGRGIPRGGHPVAARGERVGEVTSGNFSPVLGHGIALAYTSAAAALEPGDEVTVSARSRTVEGDIVKLPFVTRSKQK
ncbi:MAG: glycine cleavage system aminomethyltransferase GcvT [Actinobacteria bacterium]|nr:glycine cleavage system aminomethyltransferase GcvT [Actinomycetota bacterium]